MQAQKSVESGLTRLVVLPEEYRGAGKPRNEGVVLTDPHAIKTGYGGGHQRDEGQCKVSSLNGLEVLMQAKGGGSHRGCGAHAIPVADWEYGSVAVK